MANVIDILVRANTNQAKSSLGNLKSSIGDIVQQTTGLNVAQLGVTAAIGGTIVAVKKAITAYSDYATQVERFSRSTGTTAEEASRIMQTADDFQVSMETMESSLRIALSNGFVPTIENLATLADRYKEIQDPTKRAAEMTKIYGRSWREIESLLDQGGDKIRENAAAISDGMIVTKAGVEANIAYKKSIDDLEDAWSSLTYTLGKGLIPQLAQQLGITAKNIEQLRSGIPLWEILKQNQYEYSVIVMSSQPGMKEWGERYQGMADAAASASGEIVSGAQAISEEVQKAADKFRVDLVDAMNAVKGAQEDWMKGAGGDVADALKEAGLKGDDYRTALGLIDDAYGTGLGIQQDYRDDVADLAKKYAEGKIKGDEFKTALGEMKNEYMPLNEQVQKANDELWRLQNKWKWFQENNNLDLNVTVHQNGDINPTGGGSSSGPTGTSNMGEEIYGDKLAGGGQWVIPPGYNENYPVGPNFASSGETVTVTPKGQAPGVTIQSLTLILPGVTNAEQFQTALGQLARKARVSGAGSAGRF